MGGTFCTDSLNVHRHWTKSPEYSTRGQLVHLRVNLETNLEAHRRDRYTSHSGGMGEEPRDNAACARKHDLFVAVAGERACGRAGEERLCSSSKCRASRAKLECKGLFLWMIGEVPGSASRLREIHTLERRDAESAAAAAHASREAGGLPTGAAEEVRHTRQVFAHTHAGEDWQFLVLLEVRVPHRTTGERARGTVSRSRAELGRSTQEAQGWQVLLHRFGR